MSDMVTSKIYGEKIIFKQGKTNNFSTFSTVKCTRMSLTIKCPKRLVPKVMAQNHNPIRNEEKFDKDKIPTEHAKCQTWLLPKFMEKKKYKCQKKLVPKVLVQNIFQ